MRRRRNSPLIAISAVTAAIAALVLVVVAAGAAAPPEGVGNRDRAAVVAYWTPERVAHAMPREVSPDRMPAFRGSRNPTKGPPSGGGGGGGGSTTTVTGATWTGNGLVRATTGKVLFTMDGVDYVCSGAVANDASNATSLILTAGHCVYDEEPGGTFATNWMFVPDYEHGGSIVTNGDGSHDFTCDTTPYGCWTATALVTTAAWAGGAGSLAGFDNDYAFAVVGPGGKTGQSNQLDLTVGSNPVLFDQPHPAQVYSFGYPHASPYDGQKLVYCAGKDIADTWGGTSDYGLSCTMTGGSSGGPWLVGFNASNGVGSLTSVNSFKYTAGKFTKYMWGPYFGAYAFRTYSAAKSAVANTLVP